MRARGGGRAGGGPETKKGFRDAYIMSPSVMKRNGTRKTRTSRNEIRYTGKILKRNMNKTKQGKKVGESGRRGINSLFFKPGGRGGFEKSPLKTFKVTIGPFRGGAFEKGTKGLGKVWGGS